MKANEEILNDFCLLDGMIKNLNDADIKSAWDGLIISEFKLSSLSKAALNQARNQAIKDAAQELPTEMITHQRAKYLLLHINEFILSKYSYIDESTELTPLEKHLKTAFDLGLKVPSSDTGLYNILMDKY